MNDNIDLWFPTAIYHNNYEFAEGEQQKLISKIRSLETTIPSGGNNWHSKISNSCGTYDIVKDADFEELHNWINNCLQEYTTILGCKDSFKLTTGWFNIYQLGDFQEAHYHSGNVFSCVFYLQAPAGSSSLIVENPLMPDMNKPAYYDNHLNYGACEYAANAGELIIFRSYLRHSVPPHKSSEARISLAYNIK
jgi:uncharacterized protein (TIGR02466 family)